MDELRRRLAKRNAHTIDVAKRKAHHTTSYAHKVQTESDSDSDSESVQHDSKDDEDQEQSNQVEHPILSNDAFMQEALVNLLNSDWRVGYQLWKNLTQQLQKQITDVRNTHLPPNSGGMLPKIAIKVVGIQRQMFKVPIDIQIEL